mmetsp:Transcript_834/g.2434  ORF Transcript_834/g.2434 Transcript_834/m.2434 type:complete len:138 (+) Transcript_834:603-1016(+)
MKEDFESALTAYRKALALNGRHYTAWYGIGHVYLKQEKYGLAEQHFRVALSLHPESSSLCYHLGCCLTLQGRKEEGLEILNDAVRLDPSNPIARFERAKILTGLNQLREAYEDLSILVDELPKVRSPRSAPFRRQGA